MKEKMQRRHETVRTLLAAFAIAFVCMPAGQTQAATLGPSVTQRTQNQIYEYLMSHDVSTKDMHTFSSEPVLDETAQVYEAGELTEESKKAALQMLNNIRYIAGLDPTVTLDENHGEKAQAGAFANYVVNYPTYITLTHYPKDDGTKPEGMSDALWDLGAAGAGSSNIAYNQDTLNEAVLGWMSDEDINNINRVGHRRWILNPAMGRTGFGAANKFYAMYSMDGTNTSASQTRVVWPAQEMPVEYFDGTLPWSISVGSSISSPNAVKVTLTREEDGKEWVFDTFTSRSSDTKTKYYGIHDDPRSIIGQEGACIIFRPENFTFQAGDVYHVKAENVNGNTIEYDVHFFKGYSATKASFAKEKYYALQYDSTPMSGELNVGPGEAAAETIVWESSNKSVFTVDENGNVTGRGNGSATLTATVDGTIQAKCKITTVDDSYEKTAEYAGGAVVPAKVTVTDTETGEELEEGKDYQVLYFKNFKTNPMEPSLSKVGDSDSFTVITGKFIYGVSYWSRGSYRIVPKTITEDMITITPETFEYNGSEQKPEVVVKNGDVVMQEGTDYTLEFSGGVDAGDYTVTVKAGTNGNYTGSASKAFRIEPKDVSDEIKIIPDEDLVYNGQEQLPELAVMLGEEELIAGKGYEFALVSEDGSEVHSVDAGDYAYIVSGSGNYTFSVKGTFTINPKKLDESMVKVDELTYNGKDQTPVITVSDQGDSEGTTGSGQDNTGDADPEQNNDSPSAADGVDAEQSGAEIITEDDYDIKVPTVKDVDTYTATVTGKRNYTGTLEVKFDVLPASLKTVTVQSIEDQTYTGSEITPAVTLMFEPEEGALEEPWPVPLDDYTYTYSENNIDVGTVNVTIKPRENRAGKTNFKDEKETTFEIIPASLEKAVVSVEPVKSDSAVYDGTEQKVLVTVTLGETQIDEGNYDVAFFDTDGNEAKLIDAGSYEVKVTGKSNYKDSTSGAFTISPKPITDDMIEVTGDGGLVYNGTAQNPSVKVKDSERGVDLVEDKDFEVSFNEAQEAKNAGSYVLRVSGKGNYTSDVDKKFEIRQKALTADMVKVDKLVYNGKEQEPAVTVSDMAVPGDEAGADPVNLITADDYKISVEKVKDAGTYQVSVTALETGNYTGNVTAEFEVQKESLANVTIKEIEDQTYTGSAIKPKIVLTFKDQDLEVPQDDFIVEYAPGTNINVGSVKVTIKPNVTEDKPTNFKDQAETTFNIVPASLEKAVVKLTPDSAVYTGAEQKVSISVMLGETQIEEGNYDVAFFDADGNEAKLIDAGNYEVKVTGKGNYKDSASGAFTISPKPITDEMIDVTGDGGLVYNGAAQNPTVKVKDSEREVDLVEGKDFEVTFNEEQEAKNAGSYVLRVSGKGNYTSDVDKKFVIEQKVLTAEMVKVDQLVYNGKEQEPVVTVSDMAVPGDGADGIGADGTKVDGAGTDGAGADGIGTDGAGGKVVADGANGDPVNLITADDYEISVEKVKDAGTYQVSVTALETGNYTGSVTAEFEVQKESLANVTIKEIGDQTYTGSAIKPAIALTFKGQDLEVPQDDYTWAYAPADPVNVGTVKVTVSPKENEAKHTNFEGSAETSFEIVPASIEKAVVSVKPDSAVYSGTEQKVSVNVILGETQIDEGNYDVAFLDVDGNEAKLTDAGNYEVKVTGKGNYKDSASGAFTIAQKPVTKDMVNVSNQDLIYSGSGQAPVITVTDGEMQLKEGTDYTVTITAKPGEDGSQGSVNGDGKAVDAGSYTVKITGKGNYTSEADGYEFKVVPKQITEDMIDEIPQQDAEAAEYAMPELTIRDGEQVLKAGKDFTVEYVDNSGVGDGKALVEGIGNYTGTAEKSFKICRNIDKAVVELENATYEEDGTEKKPAVTVTLDDKLLEAEKDYKVSYKDNVKAGNATAVVTGTGYYMGSVSKEFTINAKPQPQTEEKTQEQGGDGITEPMSPENAPTSEAVNQEVTKMSDNAEIKGSGFAILQANAKKIGKNYVKLGWNRVKGAQGYIIYGNRCGTKFKMQKIKTIYSGGATSFKVKKLADGKTKLKAGTYYKFVVLAFAKDSKGAEKIIASSKSVHFITTGHKKYSNYKGVKVSKSKVTVKKGRTVKITAKAIVPSGKKVSAHRKLKCESTDPTAVKATINGAGTVVKIKGLKKTKKPVIVYVYAQSGKFAKIKVTVK